MPIEYANIRDHQLKDDELKQIITDKDDYHTKTFLGAGKDYEMICRDNRIVILSSLKEKVLEWYHTTLIYPGIDRTLLTISQHFYWKGMKNDIQHFFTKCPTCQKTKHRKQKYRYLPTKKAEVTPWEQLCIDCVGPTKYPSTLLRNLTRKRKSENYGVSP